MQDSNNGGLRVCLLITAMLVVAMATGDDAQAQPGSLKLGVQAVGVLPTSDLDDSAAKGGGINIYLAYLLSDAFCVEGHPGITSSDQKTFRPVAISARHLSR